ncbi:MAG TPA: NUDIX hydrolase [Solirubrobacterales bacterium]|nr:NUDIX hydrolase [Solirubrobacterales bacterium]
MSRPEPGPAEALNAGPPSEPRPAASVILLRRGGRHRDRALEVLLLRRADGAAFMPGVWVFPGGAVDPTDGEGEAALRACAVRELAEEAGIELGGSEELVLFSRWITPEMVRTRFDASFFLALAPPHTPPRPDGVETTEAGWFEPRAALDAHSRGEFSLVFPTIKQLEELTPFRTSAEALEAARSREVGPILPKVVGGEDDRRVVLPGDPDYPSGS